MRMVTRQVLGALLLSGCVGSVGEKGDFDAGLGGPEPTGFAGAAGGSSGGGAGGGPGAGSGGTGPGAGTAWSGLALYRALAQGLQPPERLTR